MAGEKTKELKTSGPFHTEKLQEASKKLYEALQEIQINKISDSLKNEKFDTILVAYENEEKTMLKKELKKLENLKDKKYKIAIIIGPEGGISEREIEQLNNLGAKCVSLGRRILRTETAGIIMSGDIMYELEN